MNRGIILTASSEQSRKVAEQIFEGKIKKMTKESLETEDCKYVFKSFNGNLDSLRGYKFDEVNIDCHAPMFVWFDHLKYYSKPDAKLFLIRR